MPTSASHLVPAKYLNFEAVECQIPAEVSGLTYIQIVNMRDQTPDITEESAMKLVLADLMCTECSMDADVSEDNED